MGQLSLILGIANSFGNSFVVSSCMLMRIARISVTKILKSHDHRLDNIFM